MRAGKVGDSVLKRTVLKEIKKIDKAFDKPRPGTDGNRIRTGNGAGMCVSVNTVVAHTDADIAMSLHAGCNNIYADGAAAGADAVMIGIVIPMYRQEIYLRHVMKILAAEAERIGVSIIGGHTEVSEAVNDTVITVTALGPVPDMHEAANIIPCKNEDIVMSGYAGCYGAAAIAEENEELLQGIFTGQYIGNIKSGINRMSVKSAANAALMHGVRVMHDVRTGGVFGALWELSEKCRCGFEVDMRKIPIMQETVELCERFDVNPYMLLTMGALLMVTDDGEGLVRELENINIRADVIGRLSSPNDKKITGNTVRYLDKPGVDELYRIRKLKEENGLCARKY